MLDKINKLMSLSYYEWKLIFLSQGLLLLVSIFLKQKGFNYSKLILAKFFSHQSFYDQSEKHVMLQARLISRMVSITARHGIFTANCLEQSLVLWFLLSKAGIHSEIKFGVNKEMNIQDNLDAHAWIETSGINISDSQSKQGYYLAF